LSPYTEELDEYTMRSIVGMRQAASSNTCVASMLLTVYTAKSVPQLFLTPACAAR
jgi:hypothetical protein